MSGNSSGGVELNPQIGVMENTANRKRKIPAADRGNAGERCGVMIIPLQKVITTWDKRFVRVGILILIEMAGASAI